MSKYFKKNNEKRCEESPHPRLRKNESRLLAPATTTTTQKTTAILKSPFRTS